MRRHLPMVLFATGVLAPVPLVAQEATPPTPGTMVVSMNKCSYETLDELNEFIRTVMVPIVQDLVDNGKLLGWGELEHDWGDEWNVGWYYLAADKTQFFEAFSEFFSRMLELEPTTLQKFGQWCSEHKDNIYALSNVVTPNAGQ